MHGTVRPGSQRQVKARMLHWPYIMAGVDCRDSSRQLHPQGRSEQYGKCTDCTAPGSLFGPCVNYARSTVLTIIAHPRGDQRLRQGLLVHRTGPRTQLPATSYRNVAAPVASMSHQSTETPCGNRMIYPIVKLHTTIEFAIVQGRTIVQGLRGGASVARFFA